MTVPSTRPAGLVARGWGWRHAGRDEWAVRGLDLVVEPGERILLLGASGAGKSTLLQAMAGVLGGADEGDEEGELLLDGARPEDVRGRAGLLLQDPDAHLVLARVGDDVAFGCENLGVPREEIWPRVAESLAAVGLDLPLDHSTSELSGGQKQRVALAGVLAMRPGAILLDEPTANLDPEGVLEVRDTVDRVARSTGATLVVIEHRVDVWLDVVDRVVVLGADGGVLADGPARAVIEAEGRRLAVAGVWVPGIDPLGGRRARRAPREGESLLTAVDLAVSRVAGRPVATGIDVRIAAGGALVVSGPNGAGKSTLALTLAGLARPEAGEVVAGEALAAGAGPHPYRWKSKQLLTRIGTVFQDPEHQFVTGTVSGELAVGLKALKLPTAEIDERVRDMLDRMRLAALAHANPYTLSGGQKRRLSVASALIARPRVLVLDEPTFGQDARTWAELVLLLGGLTDDGCAVVAITHDRAFIAALADHELVVRDGRATWTTTVEEPS